MGIVRLMSFVFAAWFAASATTQTPPETTVEAAIADKDQDLIMDRSGQRVELRGTLTMTPYMAVRPTQSRAYLQDDTGGIRVVSTDIEPFGDLRGGDRVAAVGRLRQHRGMPTLVLEKIRRTGSGRVPSALRLTVRDALGEAYCGRLVHIRGRVVPPPDDRPHRFWIEDETGSMRMFLRRTLFESRALPTFHIGDEIEVIGILEQYDRTKPFDEGYRIVPRTVRDLWIGATNMWLWVLSFLGALGLCVAGFAAGWRARGRGKSETTRPPRAHHLEALGTLAGGVAHDFNNYLLGITGLTELALDDVDEHSPAHRHLRRILGASDRAKSLIEQILSFSRQTDEELMLIDPRHIVHESVQLLRAGLPTSIEFVVEADRFVGQVEGNHTRIQQLLLNLGANAAQSMREQSAGTLTVSLEEVDLSHDASQELGLAHPGKFAEIRVRDTGHGMDEKTLEHIFEPFFTTRDSSEGTGLGLSLVHAIVQNHGGAIGVHSTVGRGTEFRVYFPIASAEELSGLQSEHDTPRGTGRVLFVDDEPTLANLGSEQLQKLGYEVESFQDSAAALERFERDPDAYDLVVTDHSMPGMTGIELAENLKAIRPKLPIVLITGFSESLGGKNTADLHVDVLLLKPFRRSELGRALHDASVVAAS